MAFLKNLPRAVGEIVSNFEPLQLIKAWKTVCGPVFAKQAEFRGIQNDGKRVILLLEVRDPIWRQELQFNSTRLLDALGKELKKFNWENAKIPNEISFQSSRNHLPMNSRNPKFGRKKEGI
jgi:hypothetical protein